MIISMEMALIRFWHLSKWYMKKGDMVQGRSYKAEVQDILRCLICILWYIVMIRRVIDRPFPQNFTLQREKFN